MQSQRGLPVELGPTQIHRYAPPERRQRCCRRIGQQPEQKLLLLPR